MMSIADIFDALTASDRPYKKAVPLEKALDILDFRSRTGTSTPSSFASSRTRASGSAAAS